MTTKRTKKKPRVEWTGPPQVIVIEAALLAELVKK